jgi:hypothetical protein
MATTTTAPVHSPALSRRDEGAIAFFGAWMVIGLFLDGWSHIHDKPETFFTPWHAVLYSGFGAAMAYFVLTGRRGAGANPDRLTFLGFALFGVAAVGDFGWHQLFGIEVDLSALLSPTHLGLMTGGLLMVSAPLRQGWAQADGRERSLGSFLPTLLSVTLATAVVSFFTMYLSAFRALQLGGREVFQILEVGSILLTNGVMMGAAMLIRRRWEPPFGTFTILFVVVATLESALDGFDRGALVVGALLGGLTADVLGRRSPRALAAGAPAVMWLAWFALQKLVYGEGLPVNIWTGSVVLTALSGLALSLLAFPPRGVSART